MKRITLFLTLFAACSTANLYGVNTAPQAGPDAQQRVIASEYGVMIKEAHALYSSLSFDRRNQIYAQLLTPGDPDNSTARETLRNVICCIEAQQWPNNAAPFAI